MQVYVLQHVHALPDGREDVKLIGVYSSLELARSAQASARLLPGFSEAKGEFTIDGYLLDQTHWQEGFVTIENEKTF